MQLLIQSMNNELQELKVENQKLREENQKLKVENQKLRDENQKLREENQKLREIVSDLKTKVTSRNSSLPPSKDLTRLAQTKSSRKSSGKKPGGQNDHKAHYLKLSDEPDKVMPSFVDQCSNCGTPIAESDQTVVDRQQVIDLPEVKPEVVEYVKYRAVCPNCGVITESTLPVEEVICKVQYGERIKSLITYFDVRQVIPKKRLQEVFKDVFNISLSTGTIANIISRSAEKMKDTYDQIKQYIQNSKVVGSDETGWNISGNNHWLWTYQNKEATYFFVHKSRGSEAIASEFPEGFRNSTLVSDRWAAQLKTKSKEKQLCLEHLIRDTQKLIDSYSSTWARELQKVFYDIIELTHQSRIKRKAKDEIEERIDKLLNSSQDKSPAKLISLRNSLVKNQRAITTCLYDRSVPPTNNGSEQDIRKSKIKMKIAGCFRSTSGAQYYAIIQSVLDTAIKRSVRPLNAINNPQLIFT